jgi:hypothetical protein
VLWTAAVPERYKDMEQHMIDLGIGPDSINKNPINLPFGNNGKIYYNILIDDRAGLYAAYQTLSLVISRIKNQK